MNIKFYWCNYNDKAFSDAYLVREEVFVKEQGFSPDIEHDDKDLIAQHLVGYVDSSPVCTLRLFEEKPGVFHLGRVAVLKPLRGCRLGSAMLQTAEEEALSLGGVKLVLGSQYESAAFYEKAGYNKKGDVFFEGGKAHILMYKILH